jgi:hypothetical protein
LIGKFLTALSAACASRYSQEIMKPLGIKAKVALATSLTSILMMAW